MSDYLAQIATRNIYPTIPPILSPAMPPAADAAEDPFEQNSNIPLATAPLQNNLFLQPDKSHQVPPIKTEIKSNIEKPFPGTKPESLYITRHIERLQFVETKQPADILSEKAATDFINEKNTDAAPTTALPRKNSPETNSFIKTVEKEKLEEREKKQATAQTIQPKTAANIKRIEPDNQLLKERTSGERSTEKNNAKIAQLTPAAPPPPAEASSNQPKPAPRLVIGKITVEVLPPDKPVAPKIVNRVIKAPAAAGHSKINKLSFGLGQL